MNGWHPTISDCVPFEQACLYMMLRQGLNKNLHFKEICKRANHGVKFMYKVFAGKRDPDLRILSDWMFALDLHMNFRLIDKKTGWHNAR